MRIEIPDDFFEKLLEYSNNASMAPVDYLIDMFNFGQACLDNQDLPISMIRSLQKSTLEAADIPFNFEQ